MKTENEMICVSCPMGCHVTVEMEDGEIRSIHGNTCPKGEAYARQEIFCPMRILTSTVRIHGALYDVLPVITEAEIPLEKMNEAMAEIRLIQVEAPIRVNDVITENLAGTGVRLLASRSMK